MPTHQMACLYLGYNESCYQFKAAVADYFDEVGTAISEQVKKPTEPRFLTIQNG